MIRQIAILVLLTCAFVVALSMPAQADADSFTKNMAVGERTDLRVEIPAGETDPETFIPVSVIKGALPGPTVLMVAGVHGYEFAPILAAQRLADEIDPELLSGELILSSEWRMLRHSKDARLMSIRTTEKISIVLFPAKQMERRQNVLHGRCLQR